MMMEASPIEVHGDGLQTRSLTWVGDVVEALIKVGTQKGLEGQAFNLGSTDEISMIDLATKIASLRGVQIVFTKPNNGDSKRRLPDISMNTAIDWVAKTSLDEGLSHLL